MHLAELAVPDAEEDIVAMVHQIHGALSDCFAGHIDASGHSVLPLREEDIIRGKKYMDVLGEQGSTYYLRRKFRPEKVPNWAVHNASIMEAFYHKKSIKHRATINGVRCGDEWISDDRE